MGIFNQTCSATNTPVQPGDSVAVFLVTKNNEENYTLVIFDKKDISLPFFGEYNGYGHINNNDESSYNEIGQELLSDIPENSYLIFMHEKAYHVLSEQNKFNATDMWDHKDILVQNYKKLSHVISNESDKPLAMDKISYSKRLLLLSNLEYKIEELGINEKLSSTLHFLSKAYAKYHPDILQNIFNPLLENNKESFLHITQEYLNQITLVRNMEQVNLNFTPKLYGRQIENYALFKSLVDVSVIICKEGLNKEDLDYGMF